MDNSDVQVDEICVLVDLLRSSDWGGDESRSGGRHNVVTRPRHLSEESRQMMLEVLLSRMFELNPKLGSLIGQIVHFARGRDPESASRVDELHNFVLSEVKDVKELLKVSDKIKVDLFVLTIKEIEYKATLDAFGMRSYDSASYPDSVKCGIQKRRSLWVTELCGKRIGIGYVGEDGNAEAAMAMTEYYFDVEFTQACLVGMAGGNKERVNLGNVVIAEIVHDADRRRVVSAETIEGLLQLPGRSSRVRLQSGDVVEWDDVLKNIDGSVPVDREIVRVRTTGQRLGSTVSTFNDSEECSEFVQSVTSEMPSIIPGGRKRGETMDLSEHESKDSEAVKGDELRFRVYYGPILASGALVESEQELVRLCRLYNEKALAVDMESYGFLVWCESAGLDNSLVVRGIADFCTNYKEDPPHPSPTDSSASKKEMARRKDWQYPATFRAARLLRDKLLTDVFGWPMSD